MAEAEHLASLAVRRLKRLGGAKDELAEAHGFVGHARWYTKGPDQALLAFRAARKILERRKPGRGPALARALDNEALCLQATGRLKQAAVVQHKGIAVAVAAGQPKRVRSLRRRLSNVLQDQGLFSASERLLAEARPPGRADAEERVGWLHSHALLYERWGRLAEAEIWYDEAANLYERKTADCRAQITCLINAAMLKSDMGADAQARRLIEAAARLAPPEPPMSYAVKRHVAAAWLAADIGDADQADACYAQARAEARRRNPSSRIYEHEIVAQHADMLSVAGRADRALDLLRSALGRRIIEMPRRLNENELPLSLPLIELLLSRKRPSRKLGPLLAASFVSAPAGSEEEWRSLALTADYAALQGRLDPAIFFGKIAVERVIRVVAPFPTGTRQRDAILARRERPYIQLLQRLVRSGRLTEASRVRAALAAERAYNLAARTGPAAARALTDLFSDRELALKQAYGAARDRLLSLAERASSPKLSAGQRRSTSLALTAARRAMRAFFDGNLAEKLAGKGRKTTIRPSETVRPGTAILRYYMDESRCVAELVTSHAVRQFVLSLAPLEIGRRVFDFTEGLRDRGDCSSDMHALHDQLIRPFERHLAGISRLEIAADGALTSLPFAALHDGRQYLVERFDLAYRSGAMGQAQSRGPIDSIAAFGVSRAWSELPALEHVPSELATVARGFDRSTRKLDRRFTHEALRDALKDGYGAIHIASHYHLVPGSPLRSFLLLGNGTRLSLSALLSDEFNWGATRLLFLSSCETANDGTRFEQGETFAAALHMRGVGTLIASLWPVADMSTALLAGRFYRELAVQPDAARALSGAQRAMLQDATPGKTVRGFAGTGSNASHGHPAYWAAFKTYVSGY